MARMRGSLILVVAGVISIGSVSVRVVSCREVLHYPEDEKELLVLSALRR